MERELGHARAFQRSLLPSEKATCGDLAIDARCRAVEELGGDLYDYTGCGPDGAAFLVADVSNHGASAAMLTGMIKSAFHTCEESDFEPSAVVARIAQTLATFHTDHFVTVFAGRARRGELEYASAGHPEQYVWGEGREPEALAANGTAIHLDLPRKQKVARVAFPAGSRLLLYTDGVTEVRGEASRFGTDRLLEVVHRVPGGGGALLDAILDGVKTFAAGRPLADDLTLMCIACD
jgi:sigma-B regulation protein RsbU (phosphoserine phosphatase)